MDVNEHLHRDWLGMAQPDGLVVTGAALKAAEANITWPVVELQASLETLAGEGKVVLEPRRLFAEILGWTDEFIIEGDAIPEPLRIALEGGERLAPKFAVRSADDEKSFALLVGQPDRWNADLDTATDDKRWTATPHQKFERLLRETGVHVGLLMNGNAFRLVYAPKGESAGWVTFRLNEMLSVDGRPLLGAFHMLLNERRLLSLEPPKRLLGLLKASREYQNTVSNALREQVLAALRELLKGFEHADRITGGALLGDLRREHLREVYIGLVTVLMRMVFILFAEERSLLPMDKDLYATSYSLSRLYAQLLEERGRFGDGLDDRYGTWARVTTLFRLLHDGVDAAGEKPQEQLHIPARRGDFFNPDAFPFLEGRPRGSVRQLGEPLTIPKISDGVVFRVLDQLLILGGERLQYRGLDVEQVGSVYEGLMGFELEVATGDSLCLTPEHVVVNIEALLRYPGADRVKALKTNAGLDLKDKAARDIGEAKTLDALHAVLSRRISPRQPGRIGAGSLYLQPGNERRKSGSHYTPKSLTSPIVATTLRPVLERLGPDMTPEQLLALKVCDPAMGSAAFLVEACRQLADHLVAAWRRTGTLPELPPDEDPVLHARRLIAQRCLYGVDKNPLAVDLARLSMWLVTFAKEHPFTFVDHALRSGDSLIGLSREQISTLSLDLSAGTQVETVRRYVKPAVAQAEELRRQIHAMGDPPSNDRLVDLWKEANDSLRKVRMLGDLVTATFLSSDSKKARKIASQTLATKVLSWLATGEFEGELVGIVADLRYGEARVVPFHWEIEFPEVFAREQGGFDCFIGNPPFLGGKKISGFIGAAYGEYLVHTHPHTSGNADLVAHFLLRCYDLLRQPGTLGLVATNTIGQGDTRAAGLRWLRAHHGTIYDVTRRVRWADAAVVACVVCIHKGAFSGPVHIDGNAVPVITAFLFHRGGDDDPRQLKANGDISFGGCDLKGLGFLFADGDERTTPLARMRSIVAANPAAKQRLALYVGGEDLNTNPALVSDRYAIDFGDMSEIEAARWPELLDIVRQKVRPERLKKSTELATYPWWKFWRVRNELRGAAQGKARVIANAMVSPHLAFAYQPTDRLFSHKVNVIVADADSIFCVLQSRIHEVWARMFSGTSMDLMCYTPTDCFETFPFPQNCIANVVLDVAGKTYYDFRAALMTKNNEGLTKTYNRFHDPQETSPDIVTLRDLHAHMDRAVLDAYGWSDIEPIYDFREQLDERIRLTWADDTRDEVLARLLELNRIMAEGEAKEAGARSPKKGAAKKAKKPSKVKEATGDLFSRAAKQVAIEEDN